MQQESPTVVFLLFHYIFRKTKATGRVYDFSSIIILNSDTIRYILGLWLPKKKNFLTYDPSCCGSVFLIFEVTKIFKYSSETTLH